MYAEAVGRYDFLKEVASFLGCYFHQSIESPEEALLEFVTESSTAGLEYMIADLTAFLTSNLSETEKVAFIERHSDIYFQAMDKAPVEWLNHVLQETKNEWRRREALVNTDVNILEIVKHFLTKTSRHGHSIDQFDGYWSHVFVKDLRVIVATITAFLNKADMTDTEKNSYISAYVKGVSFTENLLPWLIDVRDRLELAYIKKMPIIYSLSSFCSMFVDFLNDIFEASISLKGKALEDYLQKKSRPYLIFLKSDLTRFVESGVPEEDRREFIKYYGHIHFDTLKEYSNFVDRVLSHINIVLG